MNYPVSLQTLKSQLDLFKKTANAEWKRDNQTYFQQLIKVELKKLGQRGVSKEEILKLVEEIFGSNNFQNGKYKGGKEVVIETIHEFFGKENFKDGKFTGGWNEKQDTANIHKVFGEKNFTNGEYTGGWNQTQDLKNIQGEQNKAVISQVVEEKLGGKEKFSEGVYNSEAEIIKITEKALENKGPLLRKLRNIIGEKEFFPEEPGDGIPPGREGMRVDPEAIALQQAEQKARIDAIEKWREFYEDHGIVDANEKIFWSDKYGSNVKTAEGVYKDAILKAAEIVGEDKPLNDLEKNRINKATTPEKIKEVLEDIPKQRREKEWNNFFEKHDILNNIDPTWQANWKKSNLSIEVAKLIYNNGWYNSPEGLIGNDKKIETYTTTTDVKGKSYKKTIQKIDPLKHLAGEVKKAHDFIVKRIDLETVLDNFPTDKEINKDIYDEKQVPDTINYEELQGLRDKKIVELFKQYFQGEKPVQADTELWRTSETGLPNTGKDQRIAFDNGWTNPKEIKDSKVDYQGITGIEVLKVKKADIDAEIAKVDNLVKQINAYQFLRELDANKKSIDEQFKNLKLNLLPPNKNEEVTEAEKKQREVLNYSLVDPKDGGLEEANLKRLSGILEDDWKPTNYDPITVDMLNKFIAADQYVKNLGLFEDGVGYEDLAKSGWLEKNKGYHLPPSDVKSENNLHRDQKGAYLLEFFYKKAVDGDNYPFNPEKLKKGISFCRIGKETREMMEGGGRFSKAKKVQKEIPVIGGDKGMAGHLPIGTGIGKTTKLINCLVQGGAKHVILVCPTVGLAESAYKHHTGWLQRWGCVYHGKKGKTKMAYCRKGTYTEATDEEIAQNKAEKTKKSIYVSHGTYPVANNDLAYWYNASTGKLEGKEEGKKGLSIMYYGNLLGFADRNLFVESGGVNSWSNENLKQKVKEKLIPKEDTIIVFDEAHFSLDGPGYQALQFEMINAGYNTTTNAGEYDCLRMSATFPGTPFSATSTYPMLRMFSGKLDPKMPAGVMKIDNSEQAEIIENMRGLEPGSIKFQGENGLPIPVEVNLEERIRAGKTWYFSNSLQLSREQLAALGDKVKYTIYGEQYDENCEDVSFGQPYGSLGIVNGRREMGYTPDIDTVICSGATETKNLGEYFTYSDPKLGYTPISSLVQQMGRCGRVKWGLAITLTKDCMEIDIQDNVSAAMVKACFDGNIKQINDKAYKQIYDIDILRGALAYPSPLTFGKAPEEILIGLRITKEQQDKKAKISELDWRKNTEEDKAEALKKPWFAEGILGKALGVDIKPSPELWSRYAGDAEPVTMNEEVKLKTLKEMIAQFIAQDGSFPQGLDLKKQEKMIGAVFGDKLSSSGGKEKVVHETRTVLNGLVNVKIEELSNKDYDEGKRCSKNPNTIKKLAGLYKLANAKVDYQQMENDEGKLVWTLLMTTPQIQA